MDVKGKSTLMGFQYKLVGFGFAPNPENNRKKLQLTFFHQESAAGLYLICLSNVTRQQVGVNKIQLKQELGRSVPAEEVIIFVQRSVERASYEQFKEIIDEAFKGITWH